MMHRPDPLPVRSIVEAYYFLMVERCGKCGKGPLDACGSQREFHEGTPCRRLTAACRVCRDKCRFLFDVSQCPDEDEQSVDAVRPMGGDHPSRIVDVSQWLTLFQTIIRAADNAGDKAETRRLGFEAAQCLDEALKFYSPGEELPDEDAFLTRESFELSRSQPEQFARSRLLEHRDKLPSLDIMRRRLRDDERPEPPRKPWWRPGKRRR